MRLKDLIERCITRARRGECANCDNRYACAVAKWQSAFGMAAPAAAGAGGPAAAGGGFAPLLALFGQVAQSLERWTTPRETPFRREVEAKLAPLLPGGAAGIDAVARTMGVSRQTLYRRLKEEGFTFEHVLDDLRRRLATRYIGREGMSAKAAAYRLGFSDPAAFSRAFKRWTGRSPSDYRG